MTSKIVYFPRPTPLGNRSEQEVKHHQVAYRPISADAEYVFEDLEVMHPGMILDRFLGV